MTVIRTPLLIAGLGLSLLLADSAQGQAKTFAPEDVERTKAFWKKNATSGSNRLDCLETVNEAMRVLYQDRRMRLDSTMDKTMRALDRIGRAKPARAFGFFDAKGRRTSGVTPPVKLRESVWDGLIQMANGAKGWLLFGLSPLDGNHSVVLILDHNDPQNPKVYWADQWPDKGGFKLYPTKAALDGEIERLTKKWWKEKLQLKKIKFRSDSKVYQLIPREAPPTTQEVAEVHRTSHLFVRSAPRKADDTHVKNDRGRNLMIRPGTKFKVLDRSGKWIQIELEDGRQVWAHSWFLKISEVPRAGITAAIPGN